MASLTSLQGNGGGRIPMGSFSYAVSRHELAAIIAAMPSETCRAMHHATREGDLTTAQHLLREAAERYLTSTPAAPAVQLTAPRSTARRSRRTETNELTLGQRVKFRVEGEGDGARVTYVNILTLPDPA